VTVVDLPDAPPLSAPLPGQGLGLQFKDVSFHYPEQPEEQVGATHGMAGSESGCPDEGPDGRSQGKRRHSLLGCVTQASTSR
jgi:hypothetical protein